MVLEFMMRVMRRRAIYKSSSRIAQHPHTWVSSHQKKGIISVLGTIWARLKQKGASRLKRALWGAVCSAGAGRV